jgi:hypothetical protein
MPSPDVSYDTCTTGGDSTVNFWFRFFIFLFIAWFPHSVSRERERILNIFSIIVIGSIQLSIIYTDCVEAVSQSVRVRELRFTFRPIAPVV